MGKAQYNLKTAHKRIWFLEDGNSVLIDSNEELKKLLHERNLDIKALEARNVDLLGWRDDAKKTAEAWVQFGNEMKDRVAKVERDNAQLERQRDALRDSLKIANGNVERLQGWVDAKMNREPRLESEIPF